MRNIQNPTSKLQRISNNQWQNWTLKPWSFSGAWGLAIGALACRPLYVKERTLATPGVTTRRVFYHKSYTPEQKDSS
jgi:hypothetical protein